MQHRTPTLDVLLGLQWGDEGKGKVVDALAPRYDIVARFQGGPNAGHSLEFGGQRFVLHTIPSGIFQPGTLNVIGNGVVLDPITFHGEVITLREQGVDTRAQLRISRKAHLILPTHRMLDAVSEKSRGAMCIGSTLKGIGPTYIDKTGRNGLRVGDLERPDFQSMYEALKAKHLSQIATPPEGFDLDAQEQLWFQGLETLREHTFANTEYLINEALDAGQRVLAEGAQGTMLDVDFGSYPFVTSSSTISAGACLGLGVAPNRIGRIYGIFKAYCTRVGSGPFPTELHDATGEALRTYGGEFGATTGRPRRCGWLDMVALRYATMVNGVTHLIMTKADVLTHFDEIRVATQYAGHGTTQETMPYTWDESLQPVYRTFPGWPGQLDVTTADYEQLPASMRSYVEFVEQSTGTPISIISLGPDRTQTLQRESL